MQMGKYHRITGTAIALLTGFLLSVQPVSGMDIIKEGKAACVIVIPAKPLPAERFAADELRYHLNRSGATDFQIVPEPVLASRHSLPKGRIYIGRCRATADAGISPEKMRRFSGMIRQTGNRLFLVGRDEPGDVLKGLDFLGTWRKSAGTVIAVYDLLEKEFKIRWLWPGELGESIPIFRNFRLGETERVAAPKLRAVPPAPSKLGKCRLEQSGQRGKIPASSTPVAVPSALLPGGGSQLWTWLQRLLEPVRKNSPGVFQHVAGRTARITAGRHFRTSHAVCFQSGIASSDSCRSSGSNSRVAAVGK